MQSALAAAGERGGAFQTRYHRITHQRGHKNAVVAVGHQLLEIA
jgi:hypothetical protein